MNMKKLRAVLLFPLFLAMLAAGPLACPGNFSDQELIELLAEVRQVELEILNGSATLRPGENLTLQAKALNDQGNPVTGISYNYDALDRRIVEVDASGKVTALYPGETSLIASAGSISSDPLKILVLPPQNSQTTLALTDNALDDNWGEFTTQNSPTISRGRILWLQDDVGGLPSQLLLGDALGNQQPVADFSNTNVNTVDFLALGNGADAQGLLASWRQDMMDTWVSDTAGFLQNLGNQIQEENSIDGGCLFFRRGLPDNDIYQYDARSNRLRQIDAQGDLSDPIASGCQAVYLRDGDLVFYDGNQPVTVVAQGPFMAGDYDFRGNRIVYAKGGDILSVDVTVKPLTPQFITSDGLAVDDASPKTDGHSIVWLKDQNEAVLYDAISNVIRTISPNLAAKEGISLRIDYKQVLYREGNRLYFHDGSGEPSGTVEIPLPQGTILSPFWRSYLSEGVVALIGNDGDDEVLLFQ